MQYSKFGVVKAWSCCRLGLSKVGVVGSGYYGCEIQDLMMLKLWLLMAWIVIWKVGRDRDCEFEC